MIESGREYLKKQYTRWNNSIKLYKGECTAFRQKNLTLPAWQHIIEVNLTKPTVDAMLPNLIFKTPKVNFRPSREIVPREIQMQALAIENDMNAVQVELNLSREYTLATKDALIMGDGFVKYGLTTAFGYDQDRFPFAAPFLKRSSPFETGIDPNCRDGDLDDAEFIFFQNIIPISRFRKDNSLDKPERLKASNISDYLPQHVKEDMEKKKPPQNSAFEYGVFFELWVRENQSLVTIDEDGNIYRHRPWPYQTNGQYPLIHIGFNKIGDEFYCQGEPEFLAILQLEASEKRTQWLNHTRRFNRKYWMPPGTTEDDKTALTRGSDGTVVTCPEKPSPIEDAPMPGDVSQELGFIYQEAREVSGISAYQRGGSEQGVYTATEANAITSASNIRVESRRLEVADAISKGAKLLYDILRPSRNWPLMPFQFTVDISTMKRPDDNEKRADMIQAGSILKDLPGFKPEGYVNDLTLAFGKPPGQWTMTPEEMQQAAANQPPDPQILKAQLDMQAQQQKAQLDAQSKAADIEIQEKKAGLEAQIEIKKLEIEMEKAKLELQIMREKAAVELQIAREKHVQQMQMADEKMALQAEQAEQSAAIEGAQAVQSQAQSQAAHEQKLKQEKENASVRNQMRKRSSGDGVQKNKRTK